VGLLGKPETTDKNGLILRTRCFASGIARKDLSGLGVSDRSP